MTGTGTVIANDCGVRNGSSYSETSPEDCTGVDGQRADDQLIQRDKLATGANPPIVRVCCYFPHTTPGRPVADTGTRRRPYACQFCHRVAYDDDVLSAMHHGTPVVTQLVIISMDSALLNIHASVPLCSINLLRNNRLSANDVSYSSLINHSLPSSCL